MPGLLALALEVAHDVAVVSIVICAALNAICESEIKFRGQIEDLSRQSKSFWDSPTTNPKNSTDSKVSANLIVTHIHPRRYTLYVFKANDTYYVDLSSITKPEILTIFEL